MSRGVAWFVALAALMTSACGDGDHGPGMMMTGPDAMGPHSGGSAFLSVIPAGGSMGVPTSSAITMRFGTAMASGMEQYVDLHVGSLAGPTVAMGCAWSGDRTTLTCMPAAALHPHTTYLVHIGGGLRTQAGGGIDFGHYGPTMGGQWVTGGVMGGGHAGHPWGTMGAGWHDADGHYGMAFPFTTG